MTDVAPRPSVACVDDDTLIREGIARLLGAVDVVATYERVEALLAYPPQADIVILDLSLAATSAPVGERAGTGDHNALQGVQAVELTAAAGYTVLIYTNERRREVLAACFAAGAAGIVHKSEPLPVLADAIATVAAGRVVVTTALSGLAELLQRRGRLPTLSERQVQVLRARARGETFKSIGLRLHISPKTAEEYMGEVSRKFAEFMQTHSPADLERRLGVGDGDLLAPSAPDRPHQ